MTYLPSNRPAVSVLLPVYNCQAYVGAAIDSILAQTFTDFELIIIDDGSTDATPDILRQYSDARIHCFRQENQGLAATLNRAIAIAQASLLARQDQDDLSNPDRLARQVAYMQAHPECALLGTWAQIMEVNRLSDRYHRHPTDPGELRYELLSNNPFVHSSVMLRKAVVEQLGGYCTDPERQPPEDYELWSRIARVAEISNLPEILLTYREIPGSMSRVGPSPFRRRLSMICAENIAAATGLPSDDSSIRAIAALTHGEASELQQRPDFARMKDILLEAINGLGTDEALLPLRQDAISRVQGMQAAWMIHETPAYQLLNQVGPLRSMAKRIWRLTRSLRTSK